jgi:hypothetical protein
MDNLISFTFTYIILSCKLLLLQLFLELLYKFLLCNIYLFTTKQIIFINNYLEHKSLFIFL